jgi:hypothetical protein
MYRYICQAVIFSRNIRASRWRLQPSFARRRGLQDKLRGVSNRSNRWGDLAPKTASTERRSARRLSQVEHLRVPEDWMPLFPGFTRVLPESSGSSPLRPQLSSRRHACRTTDERSDERRPDAAQITPSVRGGYTGSARKCRGTLGGLTQFASSRSLRARKLLILKRRDVGVVDRARLESEAGQLHRGTPTWLNAHEISDLTFQDCHPVCVRKPRCFLRS